MNENMSAEQRAREVWEQACNRMLDELAIGDIAAALEQARREGEERGPGRMHVTKGVLCTKCDKPEVVIEEFEDGDCITTCSCGEQMPEHLTLAETINCFIGESYQRGAASLLSAPGAGEATEELLAAHEAYEKLLIDELTDFAGIAFAHGYRSSRVEAGKQARERIAVALAALREGGAK